MEFCIANLIIEYRDDFIGLAENKSFLEYSFDKSNSTEAEHLNLTSIEYENYIKSQNGLYKYNQEILALAMLAEKLPQFSRLLMHGAAIQYCGSSYVFCAPSGTGKTTHISLWKRYIGDSVTIINGDKPILYIPKEKNGIQNVIAYGTPWAGKEGWQSNTSAPLNAICFLKRGDRNSISEVCFDKSINLLAKQIYYPMGKAEAVNTLEMMDKLITGIPCFELTCTISRQAVEVSFEALTGRKLENSLM